MAEQVAGRVDQLGARRASSSRSRCARSSFSPKRAAFSRCRCPIRTCSRDVARFCVPTIADYCSVHLADDDGTVRRVETDASRSREARRGSRARRADTSTSIDGPGEVPERHSLAAAAHRAAARLAAALRQSAPDDETRALLDAVRPSSFMCVPLVARGRSVGAISLTMTDSGRTFTPEDMDLAMELARRTAVAVDNALIYRRSLALRLEAEAASSAKSDFLAKMSHEFRTPINAMIGYAELMEMEISGPISSAQAKQLARIRASGEHLTGLVNEILDFAKIEAGGMRVEPSNGIASDAVDAALALIRPQARTQRRRARGQIRQRHAGVEYVGDPQRVQQVLTNLLSNAVKFTPRRRQDLGPLERRRATRRDGSSTARRVGRRSPSRTPASASRPTTSSACSIRSFRSRADIRARRAVPGSAWRSAASSPSSWAAPSPSKARSAEGSRFTLWLPSPDSCTTTVA